MHWEFAQSRLSYDKLNKRSMSVFIVDPQNVKNPNGLTFLGLVDNKPNTNPEPTTTRQPILLLWRDTSK